MYVENEVEFDNDTENYSCEGDEHGFDTQKIPEDVLLMILMRGMVTTFMLTNIFGEPNENNVEVQELFEVCSTF